MAGTRILRSGVLGALFLLLLPQPGIAQKEHQGIFRGLIDNLTPDTPEQMENEALATRDATEALKLYGSLLARHPEDPEGVRAAIWIGLYYYGAGDMKTSLEYFERARRRAKSPELESRVAFWCEAARLAAGTEPLPDDSREGRRNAWDLLRELVRVDRSIRAGRPGDAENHLLSLEGDARRGGMLGLLAARWGSLLAMNGPGRGGPESLRPLELATAGLPEGIYFQRSAGFPAATPAPAPAPEETWSIQFGAFLEEENAKEQREQLEEKGCEARIDEEEEEGRHWYRVRMGELPGRAAAESLAAGSAQQSGIPYQIVRVR
jgi:tetratricopeptide (TPR) repeat protein